MNVRSNHGRVRCLYEEDKGLDIRKSKGTEDSIVITV